MSSYMAPTLTLASWYLVKVEAPIIGATVTESDDRVTRDGMAEFGANHP
jgi:hypothetical protein